MAKKMAKKMRRFDSEDSFFAWADAGKEKCFEDGTYIYVPVLIDNGWKISADFATDCAKPETAVKRFFRTFSGVPELAEWEETVLESMEVNASGFVWSEYSDGYQEIDEKGKIHQWTYCIDNIGGENSWYVSVTLSGVYTGRFD